jgi:hypothetical protein
LRARPVVAELRRPVVAELRRPVVAELRRPVVAEPHRRQVAGRQNLPGVQLGNKRARGGMGR